LVTMIAVSRAPPAKIEAFRKRLGWTFTWVSSANTDFNFSVAPAHSGWRNNSRAGSRAEAKYDPVPLKRNKKTREPLFLQYRPGLSQHRARKTIHYQGHQTGPSRMGHQPQFTVALDPESGPRMTIVVGRALRVMPTA